MSRLIDETFANELIADCNRIIDTLKRPTKRRDFEEYLQTKHAEQYTGLDDEMPDDYEEWLSGLDVQEIIDMANDWHKQ